jgi:hypothetical protein
MGRAKITTPTKDLINDDGSSLVTVAKGEQIHMNFTFGWLTDMTGFSVLCKVVEADNTVGQTAAPKSTKDGGVVVSLPVIDTVANDNQIIIVVPEDLCSGFAQQPTPTSPVYGYIDIEIGDTGVGTSKQVWKPVRGIVEITYSPTEA